MPDSSAFGQTLQFITSLKSNELERQRVAFSQHVNTVLENAAAAPDEITRVDILSKGFEYRFDIGLTSTLSLKNIKLWLHQAKTDTSIVSEQVQDWANQLENDLKTAVLRFEFAKLFGTLLTEWLRSGDSQATSTAASAHDNENPKDITMNKSVRTEMLEQKAKIQEFIFEEKKTEADAIEDYLNSLFSTPEAKEALSSVRNAIGNAGTKIRQDRIHKKDLNWLIKSLLSLDLLSAEKSATLKSFFDSDVILEEVASVLNMQMASLESWDWPEGGVFVEMRRHLSGKYRAYMDTEIVTALLFQYLGMRWSLVFKQAFRSVVNSRAWKKDVRHVSRSERRRHVKCFGESSSAVSSIDDERRSKRTNMFFMTRLPGDLDSSEASYDDEPRPGQKENQSASAQQTLLKIVNTEAYLQRSLHGECTIVRADLEWFGPSLPTSSVLAVLRFYGMPDVWMNFFQKWFNAPLRFDADAPPKTRKRGLPIAHTLSVLCGETLLFGLDFGVNQRAKGCYLYRIYDDLWWFHWDSEVCVAAWQEMQRYAALVGMNFNMKKTGAVCIGATLHPSLPTGPGCQWRFLKLDPVQGRFTIDQAGVDVHIAELRRQLASTKSVFGFVNAYNKYLAFFHRNFGDPAQCFGRIHADEIIGTFNRIQREVFPETGGSVVKRLRTMIESRFGITDIPSGWFFFPIAFGGLEVKNPVIDFLAVRDNLRDSPEQDFLETMKSDVVEYGHHKERWQGGAGSSSDEFASFEEYILGRENANATWHAVYLELQKLPGRTNVQLSDRVKNELSSRGYSSFNGSDSLPIHDLWNFALYGEEVLKRFGTLTIVQPSLIPVGMVSVFKSAKISWDS